MSRKPSPQPTQVELEILNLLWEHGPCVLGEIHKAVSASSDRAYSTTRKMIQVMCEKGLVTSDESARPQRYSAATSQIKTQLNLLEDLAQRAFGGSTNKLVMSLLAAKRVSVEEVQAMQQLIHNAKGGKR